MTTLRSVSQRLNGVQAPAGICWCEVIVLRRRGRAASSLRPRWSLVAIGVLCVLRSQSLLFRRVINDSGFPMGS